MNIAVGDFRRVRNIDKYVDGFDFDSKQEFYFYFWCKELQREGFILDVETQPKFVLFEGVKISHDLECARRSRNIDLVEHVYHADFKIKWSRSGKELWGSGGSYPLLQHNFISYIEIKPLILQDAGNGKSHKIDPGKREYFTRMNIKWVYQRYGVIVQIVTIDELFRATFYPLAYTTCAGKIANMRLIGEFLEGQKRTPV